MRMAKRFTGWRGCGRGGVALALGLAFAAAGAVAGAAAKAGAAQPAATPAPAVGAAPAPAVGVTTTPAAGGPTPAGAPAVAAPAAPPSPDAAATAPAGAQVPGLYIGPTTCGSSSCHGGVRPRQGTSVRQDEYFIWLKRDPHARAYERMFDDRFAVITRNLRLGAASAERTCLGCHAFAVPAERQQRRLEIEDGISCESCHGPASGWLESHRAEGETHEQSVAAGMIDLRHLDVRSTVCLSCHLGTGSRMVDHELLAAGHPQLTFELDNYSEAMPAHWLPWADRPDRATRADTHGTPAWAVGQAAALRAALDQLAARARAASAGNPARRWPEFAQLTCDSCHHALAEERWRTAPAGERPGLPRWSQAHYAVLRVAVAAAAPDALAALDPGMERLARMLERFDTPPAEVAAGAEGLSRAVAELVPRLARAPWDEAQARRLLLALSDEHGVQEGADYASARQIVLAVQTLASQLLASDRRWLRAGLATSAEELSAAVQRPYEFDRAKLAARLALLRRQIQDGPTGTAGAAGPGPASSAGSPGGTGLSRTAAAGSPSGSR